MQIKEPGKKYSDKIIARYVAENLGIPENIEEFHNNLDRGEDRQVTAADSSSSKHKTDDTKDTTKCPPESPKKKKSAADTSILEYYKKLYPFEYVSQLTESDTKVTRPKEKVTYEPKPATAFPDLPKKKAPEVKYPDPKVPSVSLKPLPPNGPDPAKKKATRSRMLTREQIAKICPECAEEMRKNKIKAVSAEYIARQIAKRAQIERSR